MTNRRSSGSAITLPAGALCFLILAGFGTVCAQEEDFRLSSPVPPPMRFVAAEQRSQLESESDEKKHARLSLELAELRLEQAEAMTSAQDFVGAAIELGNYQGLIQHSIGYLQAIPSNGDRRRDLFKRLEIALRTHCPRLENLRRTTPQVYSVNIREVIRFAEESRDISLNSFFGDTVLPKSELTAPRGSTNALTEGKAKQSP